MATRTAPQKVNLAEWLRQYFDSRDGYSNDGPVDIQYIKWVLETHGINYEWDEFVEAANALFREKFLTIDLLHYPLRTPNNVFLVRLRRHREPPHSDVSFPI